jgi:hypothetical protein
MKIFTSALDDLVGVVPQINEEIESAAGDAQSSARHYEDRAQEQSEREPDDIDSSYRPTRAAFDLNRLFSDL